MPQDLGYGVTHWGANETKAFNKYWDSDERKAKGEAAKAEYKKLSPYEQKKYSRKQREVGRRKEGTNFSFKQWNRARQNGDASAQRNQEARLQKRADWRKSRQEKRAKRQQRRTQRRMAGDVFQK